jgi:hypothetical protein
MPPSLAMRSRDMARLSLNERVFPFPSAYPFSNLL